MGYYLAHHKAPAFLFTSDAEFSGVLRRRGGFDGLVTSKLEGGNIVDFTTGDAATNAVPSQATLIVEANAAELPAPAGFEVTTPATAAQINRHGQRRPMTSLPEGWSTPLACSHVMRLSTTSATRTGPRFLRLAVEIMDSTDGSSIGIDTADAYFDPLTCIAGTIHMVDDPTWSSPSTFASRFVHYGRRTTEPKRRCRRGTMQPAKIRCSWFRSSSTRKGPQSNARFFIPTPPVSTATVHHRRRHLRAREFPCAAASAPKIRMTDTPSGSAPCTAPMRVFRGNACCHCHAHHILAIKRLMEIDLESLAK